MSDGLETHSLRQRRLQIRITKGLDDSNNGEERMWIFLVFFSKSVLSDLCVIGRYWFCD